MKLKLLLGLLLVVGMIGLGSAAEEDEEQSYGAIEKQFPERVLTPDEAMAIFGNSSWVLPDELRQSFKKSSIERKIAREKNKTSVIKKPLTPEEIAEINANAPERVFLVSGIEDDSMKMVSSGNTQIENVQIEDVQIEDGKIVMDWSIFENMFSSNLIRNSATVSVPNVAVIGATCNWKWVQNESAANQITIMNYGTVAADGFVMIYSYEDSNGWARSYTNLAPSEERTISLPFYVDTNLYTTVGAKSITIRNYVVINSIAYLTSAPTVSSIFVEVYNNNNGYLEDPDNGRNLQLTDLHHHDEYEISVLAAQAGDNTSNPYETGEIIMGSVDDLMTYSIPALDPTLTGSDHWIVDNGYEGICDEFAVLNGDFARALGVPARTIACNLEEAGQPDIGHQFNEIWGGNAWIHSDANGAYDDTQVYNNDNKTVDDMCLVYDSDDSLNNTDGPDGDGILHSVFDSIFISAPDLELIYN